MKSTFKLGSIEVAGVKLNNIEFTQEYTATEAISLMNFGKNFVKELIKELPEMMEDLAKAQETMEELDERFDTPHFESSVRTEMPEHIKAMLANLGINPENVRIREI